MKKIILLLLTTFIFSESSILSDYNAAWDAIDSGQCEKGLKTFNKFLELLLTDPIYKRDLQALSDDGEYMDVFTFTNTAFAYYGIASSYVCLAEKSDLDNSNHNHWDSAYFYSKKAYDLKPENFDFFSYLFDIELKFSKTFSEVESIIKDKIELYPEKIEYQMMHAHYLNRIYSGKNSKIVKILNKALKVNPESEYIKYVYYELGVYNQYNDINLSKAIFNYKNAINVDSSYTDAYLQLGIALQANSKNSQAIEYYKKAALLGNLEIQNWLTENDIEF